MVTILPQEEPIQLLCYGKLIYNQPKLNQFLYSNQLNQHKLN
jgi:hypothetical protein